MTVSVEQIDSLTAFAQDPVAAGHEAVQPWTGDNEVTHHISKNLVGGDMSQGSPYAVPYRFSCSFKPMTIEDFKRLRPERDFSGYEDPGGPPGMWDWVGDYNLAGWGDAESNAGAGHYENPWFDYYNAKENDGEAASYSPPGDAPWAQELADNWNSAVANRFSETAAVVAELLYVMECLFSAAEEYADVDLANADGLSEYDFS